MRDKLTINANREEYGDGRAQIFDLGLVDARGNITNLLLKGEEFTIRERIRFNAPIQAPIFTYTIKDKKGTDLTGTNTLFEERMSIRSRRAIFTMSRLREDDSAGRRIPAVHELYRI